MPNADRQPPALKITPRTKAAPAPEAPTPDPQVIYPSGRTFQYEWELADQQLRQEMEDIVISGVPSYTHSQSIPAKTWVINHNLGLMPNCLLVDDNGHQMVAEIQYPNTMTVVVVHSQPYSGTAYLRP